MQELDDSDFRILFVSYSDPSKPLHRMWIEEWTKANTDGTSARLLLDPTKSAYESWSIPSSAVAAWGIANCWYYAKAILFRGRRSIAIKGEASQLGADFVLGPGGTVLLKHYCHNPTDRVHVRKILDVVRLNKSQCQKDKNTTNFWGV